ncbi:MAG: hypothetical protein PVSMB4_20300 [Ktedonobacterales bacterium]
MRGPYHAGMPIYECDPWRLQCFTQVACPRAVHVPTDDPTAYALYPDLRWTYNKLLIARSQDIECGVADDRPGRFPVFGKPIINLRGMGVGSQILRNERELYRRCKAQHFWMELLTGVHVSTDCAVVRGDMAWHRHTQGIAGHAGTFNYWIVEARSRPTLDKYCRAWISRNLSGYTGMVNIETIGDQIIEVHLRFSDQWPDLYGAGWVESVVRLYKENVWRFSDTPRTNGYSVVLFGTHGIPYVHLPAASLARYRAMPDVSSVQVTFFEDLPQQAHAMPPGGFRLAVINCHRLEAGLRVRREMAREFGRRAGVTRDGSSCDEGAVASAAVDYPACTGASRQRIIDAVRPCTVRLE